MEQHSFVKFVPGIHAVYLSVPKVASSSISFAMLQHAYAGGNDIQEHSELGKALTNRRPVTLPYPQLPVFTFVRHPIDKFLSYYRNKFEAARHNGFELVHLPKLGFDPDMSLDDVVAHMWTIDVDKMEHHAQPQWRIVTENRQLIPDWVEKVENIDETWSVIADLSGCQLSLSQQRNQSRASNPRNYLDFMSELTLARLVEYYRIDFTLFDYSVPRCAPNAESCPPCAGLLSDAEIIGLKQEIRQRTKQTAERAAVLKTSEGRVGWQAEAQLQWRTYFTREYRRTARG